jgi:hypothetical protein
MNELFEALHGEMVPKFLATRDAEGRPNVVPIISLDLAPDDDGKLIFGEFLIWKTRKNLGEDPRVAACVLTEDLQVWTLRARFREFVDRGPYVEFLNRKEMFRYNAYVGIRRAAVFDLEEVTGSWNFSKLNVAAELLPVKLVSAWLGGNGRKQLPERVAEKFARTQAVKVMAHLGADGYPRAVPLFSLVPTKTDSMVFGTRLFRRELQELAPNARVAASVITMDPVAYQVKGLYEGSSLSPAGRIGRMRVLEVYSASPPLSGQAIDLQQA